MHKIFIIKFHSNEKYLLLLTNGKDKSYFKFPKNKKHLLNKKIDRIVSYVLPEPLHLKKKKDLKRNLKNQLKLRLLLKMIQNHTIFIQ